VHASEDVNGRDVPIMVDVVDTTKELVAGESLPPGGLRPHMVLTPEDGRCIQGKMLTGWKGKADLLKGWAIQGKNKNQIPQEARGREAGEQICFKHLQVKMGKHMARIVVLFDMNVPNNAWYQVPLLNTEGYTKLIRASGVMSTAHIET
jgi:hypothetical protein